MVTFAFIIKKMVKVIPYVHSDVNCPGDDTFVFMFMSKMLRYFAIFGNCANHGGIPIPMGNRPTGLME